jgi:uncharacterized protein YndB with AHSA1/START domain
VTQIEVTASEVIAVPPAQLWELVSDTSRNPEWVAGTAAVTRTDGPARQGSTYDEINPIMGPFRAKTRWTVIELDPPRRQVHRSEDVPFARETLIIIDLTPSGDGTKVTVTLRARGRRVLRVLKSRMREDNERSVGDLAALAARAVAHTEHCG